MRHSRYGVVALTAVALLLGVLAVTQFRSREVFSRALTAESAASLTTLIAQISDRNSALRDEILALRLRLEAAQLETQSGLAAGAELRQQLDQFRVATSVRRVSGPGVHVRIEGQFDERAMTDLVNELRNAGAEAIAVNGLRVTPRSFFARAAGGIAVGERVVASPYLVAALGAPDTIAVALTRTGGIIGQFRLIYPRTRFTVTQEPSLALSAGSPAAFAVARPAR